MLGSIDFAKRIIGSARTVSEQTMPAVATSDSVDGVVTMAVGKPLEDQDGNLVPEFDEDGNELGDLGNVTEAATVGNVREGDAVVFGNGFATGTVGGGDAAASGATDYITENADGSIMLGYGASITFCDSAGNKFASFGEDGLKLYVANEATLQMYEEGIVGRNALTKAEIGRISFINGVDVTPSSGNLFTVHGESEFDGPVSMPGKLQAGTVPVETVASNSVREVAVTFPTAFASAPAVIVSLESPQTQLLGNCAAYVHNRTSAGFTLRIINNNAGNTRDLGASWVAVAK